MTTTYNKPDLNAPRYRKEVFDIKDCRNKEFYNNIKEKYPELKVYSNKDISFCIELFNKRLASEVINNRNGVKLPAGLGIILAGACKVAKNTASQNIDYKTSEEVGQTITHQNNHTDRYVFKIKYSSEIDKHLFPNHHMWCFDASREFTRTMASEFKKEGAWKKYIVFNTKQHISHIFRSPKIKKDKIDTEQLKRDILKNYNEFDI